MIEKIDEYGALIQRNIAKGAEYISVCVSADVRKLEAEHEKALSKIKELKSQLRELSYATKGLLTDSDDSWCTCNSDEGDGCYYHDAIEALSKLKGGIE